MEETEEMKEASKIINKAQNNYEKLKFIDFINDTHSDRIKKRNNQWIKNYCFWKPMDASKI